MNGRSRVEIRSQKPLLDDAFKVNEVIVSHRQYDGKMSCDQRRLVFERGDAVAALFSTRIRVRSSWLNNLGSRA